MIQSMTNSAPLDISDMPTSPSAKGTTNPEEALVHSLVAAAHATIAKVPDPASQKTRNLSPTLSKSSSQLC